MWEVPDRAPSGSGSITAGYGYPNEAGPIPEDFDIVFIVRYRDGEVTYSVREMGLLDRRGEKNLREQNGGGACPRRCFPL